MLVTTLRIELNKFIKKLIQRSFYLHFFYINGKIEGVRFGDDSVGEEGLHKMDSW